ncbi:MAG: DUF6134 family protein [Woeseiaceae bacterium]|nr:DUF6134 family protein [Woeseiaceae bacterium]
MRRKSLFSMGLLILFGFAAYSGDAVAESEQTRAWKFSVFLDDKRIGEHRFEVRRDGEVAEVRSEADFDVKFLFVNVYSYEHSNSERWKDGCLQELEASTNTNGKQLQVRGEKTENGFVVKDGESAASLPECVMTFAYWNPDFLEQQKLLNPQTGEYVDVRIEKLDAEPVIVGDREVMAQPYRIDAGKVQVTVYYSMDDQWLALESPAKGGRLLRYRLT